jgi:hypothetical protein
LIKGKAISEKGKATFIKQLEALESLIEQQKTG